MTLGAVLATKLASAVDRSCIWVNGALSVIEGLPVNLALYLRRRERVLSRARRGPQSELTPYNIQRA
jgi:hypothetical protein